jgi:hypothetical protein
MILFQVIIEMLVGPMLYFVTHGLTYGSWIGTMPICCHLLGSMVNHSNSLLEKSLSCFHTGLSHSNKLSNCQ